MCFGEEVSFSYNAGEVHSHEFTDALGSKTTFFDNNKLDQIGDHHVYLRRRRP